MGQSITHGAWEGGSYARFHHFRLAVIRAADYKTIVFDVASGGTHEATDLNWEEDYTERNLSGRWKYPPDDPLLYFIVLEQSNAKLAPKHLVRLVGRLVGLLPKLDEDNRKMLATFIRGAVTAIERDEKLDFG